MSAWKRAGLGIFGHISHEWARRGGSVDDGRRQTVGCKWVRRVGSRIYDFLDRGDLFAVRESFEESELSLDELYEVVALGAFEDVE